MYIEDYHHHRVGGTSPLAPVDADDSITLDVTGHYAQDYGHFQHTGIKIKKRTTKKIITSLLFATLSVH